MTNYYRGVHNSCVGDIGSISDTIPSCSIMFRETPSSYNYSWHNAPRRQFIVNLDASVQITVSSGEIRTLGEGEVMFVEDTHGGLIICMHAFIRSFQVKVIYLSRLTVKSDILFF